MSLASRDTRGQATLAAFAVAVVIVIAALSVALAVADGAVTGETRDATDARLAAGAADRLTAADAAHTRRRAVLNATRIGRLTATNVTTRIPALTETAFRIELGDRVIAERGDPTAGATVRRIVLVGRETPRTRTVNATRAVSLPRRTATLRFDFRNASVETVRVGDRVVLHDPDGLTGPVAIPVRRSETARVTFGNATGRVEITSYPTRTQKRRLVVTVDA